MADVTFETLVSAITDATRKTLAEIFEGGERFYYFALITNSGSPTCPVISAWSWEAFEKTNNEYLKWEWADSPYYDCGEEYFKTVREIFNQLPDLGVANDEALWEIQFHFRVNAMVEALKRLDDEGLFAKNQPRKDIFVNVEMTDGYENIKRALQINEEAIVKEYLNGGFYADDGRR